MFRPDNPLLPNYKHVPISGATGRRQVRALARDGLRGGVGRVCGARKPAG
jgi:hypothetical protein